MFYLFPMILPITKGNVVKSFIIGLVALIVGLYFVTELAGFFTLAAKDVYAATGDPTVNIPAGFEGGALDFASSLFCWGYLPPDLQPEDYRPSNPRGTSHSEWLSTTVSA